ncbi:MAG: hypothetical protein ACI9LU_000227 [Polaribacter sp.]|jgi:hypothetical protein
MILRRVIKHFRHQEWTAIAIDFVIVVVGVFVGIQVSNWNQAQSDRSLGEKLTERLRADLVVEAWNYAMLIEYLADVQSNTDKALAGFTGRNKISDEQLLIAAYRATQYNAGIRQSTTYDELISTGKIAFITDKTLVNTAILIYAPGIFDQLLNEGVDSAYRETFRKTLPVEIQDSISQLCGDRFVQIGDFNRIKNQLNYPCTTDLSPQQFELAVNKLRGNPAILENLRLRAMNVRTQHYNLVVENQDIFNAIKNIKNAAPAGKTSGAKTPDTTLTN